MDQIVEYLGHRIENKAELFVEKYSHVLSIMLIGSPGHLYSVTQNNVTSDTKYKCQTQNTRHLKI